VKTKLPPVGVVPGRGLFIPRWEEKYFKKYEKGAPRAKTKVGFYYISQSKQPMTSIVTHYIEGEQVLTRADILAQYRLTPATIQCFLEQHKPKHWVANKNKYYYSKKEMDDLLS
jgi:hypothetical protein